MKLLLGDLSAWLLVGLTLGWLPAHCLSKPSQHFEVQPEAQYLVHSGHDARLRCLVRDREGECLWLRDGRAIGVIAKKYQFVRSPDDGDCSLTIRNVSVQQDDGSWQCQVTASDVDRDSLQSRPVQLLVLVAPERALIKNVVSRCYAREIFLLLPVQCAAFAFGLMHAKLPALSVSPLGRPKRAVVIGSMLGQISAWPQLVAYLAVGTFVRLEAVRALRWLSQGRSSQWTPACVCVPSAPIAQLPSHPLNLSPVSRMLDN